MYWKADYLGQGGLLLMVKRLDGWHSKSETSKPKHYNNGKLLKMKILFIVLLS